MSYLDSPYKWYHILFVFLTSFIMIISRFFSVPENGIISFFMDKKWKIHTYSIVCMNTHTPHLIYSFICRWTLRLLPCLDCCKWCCSKHWIIVLSEHMPRSGIAVSYGSSVFSFFFFLKKLPEKKLLHNGCTNLQSYQQYKKVPFLHTFSVFIIFRHFNHGHLYMCLVVAHCSFNLYFSNN